MAEQTEQVMTSVLQRLQERQEAVLSHLGSLQLRLNKLQRESDLPYDTSNLSLSEFKRSQTKQDAIFERLLGVAGQIENEARRQNIELPARDEVGSMIQSMANSLAKRQQRTLSQLNILKNAAQRIQDLQMTPKLQSFIDGAEPMDDVETKEDRIEDAKDEQCTSFKSRIYDLESVAECLRAQCQRMDVQQRRSLTVDQMMDILDTVTMLDIDGSVKNEKHIAVALGEMSVDSRTDYNSFLDRIVDCDATDKLESAAMWNQLRYNLVGNGRVEGAVRILYRYDGWPEPQSILISSDTRKRNKMPVNEVLHFLKENTKDSVEFHELRCASKLSIFPLNTSLHREGSDSI